MCRAHFLREYFVEALQVFTAFISFYFCICGQPKSRKGIWSVKNKHHSLLRFSARISEEEKQGGTCNQGTHGILSIKGEREKGLLDALVIIKVKKYIYNLRLSLKSSMSMISLIRCSGLRFRTLYTNKWMHAHSVVYRQDGYSPDLINPQFIN